MAEIKAQAEALLPLFQTERILNQDSQGRRVALLGTISSQRALLVIERGPFSSDIAHLSGIVTTLSYLENLGSNDVYRWYLGSQGGASSPPSTTTSTSDTNPTTTAFPDLKLNLFYPASDKHVRKYAPQRLRVVHETPAIYADTVRPWIVATQRQPGRIKWIYDILEGRAEAEDVIYRTDPKPKSISQASDQTTTPTGETTAEETTSNPTGFVILPDLNWDRRTTETMHLLALMERRDLWSVRDLRRKHVPWLRTMRAALLAAATRAVPGLEEDQVKMYVHYQPTYYHLHVHVVHVALDAGGTQAVGKAVGLDAVIATLEAMGGGDENGEAGMQDVAITYHVGEESELWRDVWEPIKRAGQEKRTES